MKLKKFLAAGIATLMIAGTSMTAMAGQWTQFNGLWYYLHSNGQLARNEWAGNYYLAADGHMLTNTYTPDGYYVGNDGKWVPTQASGNSLASFSNSGTYLWSYSKSPSGVVSNATYTSTRTVTANNDKTLTIVEATNGVTGSTSQVSFLSANDYISVINNLRYSFINGEMVITDTDGSELHYTKIA